jgi:hypothetical protein
MKNCYNARFDVITAVKVQIPDLQVFAVTNIQVSNYKHGDCAKVLGYIEKLK